MSGKFHINGSGNPGKCSAKQGGCPFGEDSDHYSTREEAREQYEKANTAKVFQLKPKVTLSELNKIAKTSTNQEELKAAILNGSSRTLTNLATNQSASAEVLGLAYDKSEDSDLKYKLELHKNFPVGKLTKFGLQSLRKKHPFELIKKMRSDDVTDAQAQIVLDKYPMNTSQAIIGNPNNKISQEMLIKLAEQNTTCLKTAIINNSKYSVKERMSHYDNNQLEAVASNSSDPEIVNTAIDQTLNAHNRERILYTVLHNSVITSEKLKEISEETNDEYNQLKIYSHPNSNKEIKEILAKKNSTVASLNKLDELVKNEPKTFKELEDSIQVSDLRQRGLTSFSFDPLKVTQLGLDSKDIDAYVRIKKNNWLQHTKYDEATGIYSGYRD